MHKYSQPYRRNAFLPIKFRLAPGSFVDYPYTNDKQVTRIGTWFHVYAKTCIQGNIKCRCGTGSRGVFQCIVGRSVHAMTEAVWGWMGVFGWELSDCPKRSWKNSPAVGRNGKIILEICIDICYTDSVPGKTGTDETLPAPRAVCLRTNL